MIGFVALIICIAMCLHEAPWQSLAVIGVGLLPFIIVNSEKLVAWLVWLTGYTAAVAGAGVMIYYTDSGVKVFLFLFLPLIVIASWGAALDG